MRTTETKLVSMWYTRLKVATLPLYTQVGCRCVHLHFVVRLRAVKPSRYFYREA